MQEQIIPIRVFYSKTGRARYISHLDTMRTITRALRRSGLPVWYTMGFNPHLYLTFLLPLALGVESLCEIVDIRLTAEMALPEIEDVLRPCLPPGFDLIRAAVPEHGANDIEWAEYNIELRYPESELKEVQLAFYNLFERQSIEVIKKTKKGEQLVDIRPHAELLGCESVGGELRISLRLAAGNTLNIAPKLILDAFFADTYLPERVFVTRTRVLDGSLRDFA